MFDETISVQGDALPLADFITPYIEARILDLAVEAYERWAVLGFKRMDDEETSMSVALVGQMWEVIRKENLSYVPQVEKYIVTDGMFEGRASVKKAARIDIAVAWALSINDDFYSFECKKLGDSTLGRLYVNKGIVRFRKRRYAANTHRAAMIGFVVSGSIADIVIQINKYLVKRHWKEREKLVQRDSIRSLKTAYRSCHLRGPEDRGLIPHHLMLDLSSQSLDLAIS